MSYAAMRLGRIARPIPAGVPTLAGHRLLTMQAPPVLDRRHIDYRPQMDGNDTCGDCTCALVANVIRAQAAVGGFQVDVPTSAVLGLYGAVSGYPAKDDGAYEVDVLTYQSAHGLQGADDLYVGLWANLPRGDLNAIRLATTHLGMAYLAVSLAEADQAPGLWVTNPPASAGDPKAGSWGQHALGMWSYSGIRDDDVVQLETWGKLQPATWGWVRSRLVEAHALFYPQMLPPGAPIDRDRVAADMRTFAAS